MTNQMGDVIGINDCTGDSLVIYLYDEWGKVTEICPTLSGTQAEFQYALGEANPLRYRGYYYDNETGYYYLQSRYYDPSICRFINSDLPMYIQITKGITSGVNSYAYCFNTPVMFKDLTGTSSLSGILQFIILRLKLVQISSPRKMYIEIRFSLNSSSYGSIKKVIGKIYCKSTSAFKSKNYIYYNLSYIARGITYHVYETTGRYNRPAKGEKVRVGWERVYLYMINGQISLPNGSSLVTIK